MIMEDISDSSDLQTLCKLCTWGEKVHDVYHPAYAPQCMSGMIGSGHQPYINILITLLREMLPRPHPTCKFQLAEDGYALIITTNVNVANFIFYFFRHLISPAMTLPYLTLPYFLTYCISISNIS